MSFRKRNVGLSRTSPNQSATTTTAETTHQSLPGVRSSPIDGRPTTSTGTPSLDSLLAGHSGLALGNSLLIEESGTTDYAGSLLRFFAAEGLLQGHHVHLLGLGDRWMRELPAAVGAAASAAEEGTSEAVKSKMKIAWRYESLGRIDDNSSSARASPAAISRNSVSAEKAPQTETVPFCHVFDLTKRLEIPVKANMSHYGIDTNPSMSPFHSTMQKISTAITNDKVHRLIIPNLLSPALYPPSASQPQYLIQFLHFLRGLLRKHPDTLTIAISFPVSLHPRRTALVRWIELLCDGVLELTPFPHRLDDYSGKGDDDQPQGLVKIHTLPVFHERGGGGGTQDLGNDLAFTVSRRRFAIKPFSLPPAEGDTDAQKEAGSLTKDQIDF